MLARDKQDCFYFFGFWRVFIPAEIDPEADLSEVLVELVKMHPSLWNVGTRAYRDRNKKEQVWAAVLRAVRKT